MPTDRRSFLRASGAGLAALGLPASSLARTSESTAAGWIHPIGLQLFTVRAALQRDFVGTLARVAQIGKSGAAV